MSLFDPQHGTISGTVPASATDFDCSITVTDSLGVTSPAAMLQITVPILFQAGPLAAGQQGQAGYSASLAGLALGGSGSYAFSIASGSLPTGLSIGPDGSISGTISESATTATFTAQVTDSSGAIATQSFTINVTLTPVSVTSVTASAAQIEQGQPALTLTATVSDASNSGVTFAASCAASQCGTVTTTSLLAATYVPPSGTLAANLPVTVIATSVKDPTKSASATVTVIPGVTIPASASAPLTAAINQPISLPLVTPNSGVAPYSLAIVASAGSSARGTAMRRSSFSARSTAQASGCTVIPAWLMALFDAQHGTISGNVPTTATDFDCSIAVTDSLGVTSPAVMLQISVPIAIVTSTLPSAEQTQSSYTATLSALGGSGGYSWTVAAGALPSGLTLTPDGAISGSPGAATTTETFTVQATDSANASATQQLTVTITPQVAITAPSAPSLVANIGNSFILQLQTTPGTGVGSITWALANGSTLPSWLNLSSVGVLSATQVPTTANTTPFTVQAKDSANVTASLPLTLTVPITIVASSLPVADELQSSYSATLTAEGGSGGYTWTVLSGSLPLGLTLAQNGTISGSPSATATTQTFTAKVTDSVGGTATQSFTITVNSISVDSVSASAAQIEQGQQGLTLTATVSNDPSGAGVTFGVSCAAAPCGTVTNTSALTATYTAPSGSLAASLSVTVTATSIKDPTKSKVSAPITVIPGVTVPPSASQPVTASINQPFSLSLVTPGTGVAPFNLTVGPPAGTSAKRAALRRASFVTRSAAQSSSCTSIPAWLMALFDLQHGTISGTVSNTATDFDCSIAVTDSLGVTSPAVTLQITVQILLQTGSLPGGEQTQSGYSASIANLVLGGSGTYSFSGSLPAGLSIAADGTISGNISANASTPNLQFMASVNDADGTSATQSFTIPITPVLSIVQPEQASLLANIGGGFNLALQTSPGTGLGAVTWSEASGNLSKLGLSLSSAGVLSAAQVPVGATTQQLTFQAKDSVNVVASLPVTITVPIKIATSSLPSAEQTQTSYSATLTAQGGTGVYSWTVIAGALPSGLALAQNGSISGSPNTGATTQTFTVQVTDSANAIASQQYTVSINPQVAIAAPSQETLLANIGNNFSLTLQTSPGTGVGPFTWALATGSNLPPWLILSSAGMLSAVQVPTTANTTQFTVQVKDSANVVGSLPLTLTVPIKIVTPSLPSAEQTQTAYNATLTAEGGSGGYSWTISAGALPSGLVLAQNGTLSGTPSMAATTQTFTVQVTDSSNVSVSQQYTVSINPQVAIAAPSSASLLANIGGNFSLTLQTSAGTGVGPFTWSVATGSTLPPWAILSTGGVLSAVQVPTTANTTQFTVQVKDSANVVASLQLTLTVPIKIVTPSLPSAEQTQTSYSGTLNAEGGSGGYSWTITAGALPAGLTLAQNGTISGTPSVAAVTQTFTVQVTDSANSSTTQQFTVAINPQVAIAAPSAASLLANIGGNFNLPLQTTAGTGVGPFTWALATGSTLPSWLNLSSGGVLSATQVPTTANTAQFTVQVTDSANISASLSLTLTVPIKILTTSLFSGEVTLAYSSTALTAQGGSGSYTWTATGLPGWATINSSTGVISGNPMQGSSNVMVKATDSLTATATAPLTLTIFAQVAVNSASLPNGALNAAYSQTLSASNGLAPYSNWLISGTLPTGLSLDKNSGVISGTPTCPAPSSNFSVTVQDFLNVTSAPQQLSITTSTPPPVIATTALPGDTIGLAYSQQLQATGGGCGALTWSIASGSTLPAWLQLSSVGLLSGTPGAGDIGSDSFTVQVSDGVNTATQLLTILVGGSFKVSGQVSLVNGGGPLAGVVVTVGNNLSATTDASGNFTIPNVVSGTYTLTPLIASAPSSAFYPASQNITNTNGVFTINVNGADLTGVNFTAGLGFTVSGTITYSGLLNPANLNNVFVRLQPTNCTGSNCSIPGTNAPTPIPPPNSPCPCTSSFSIQGVPPGTYTLQAWMDYPGYGIQNFVDPAGTASTPVTVTRNISNAAVALTDPPVAGALPGPNPKASVIQPNATDSFAGLIIQYQPIVQNGVEQATKYNLQWIDLASQQGIGGSNSTCQTSPDGGLIIEAGTGNGGIIAGSGRTVILDSNNTVSAISSFPIPLAGYFQSGHTYFICMQGLKLDLANANSGNPFLQGAWNFVNGNAGVTIPNGPPAGGNAVSGNIIIPDLVSPAGPLYTGCYDVNSGNIYAASTQFDSLVTASVGMNPYSVSGVPTGASCFIFAMIDQDSDGLITPVNPTSAARTNSQSTSGDIYNTSAHNPTTVTITGNTTQGVDVDLTAYSNNSNPAVSTQHVLATNVNSSTQESININLLVTPSVALPTQVTLLSGPNVIAPADFAICTTCGEQSEFNISLNTNGVRPQVGDSYVFQITYSDPTQQPEVVTLSVSGVSDAFATSLQQVSGGNPASTTTPTFSWTDPANPTSYSYRFLLSDSTGNAIWQIPGPNVFSNFFSFSGLITSVPWSTTKDPTGAKNPPSVTSLTSGATYTWSISVQDSNGNSAQQQVQFKP
jgi:hypothetical protein